MGIPYSKQINSAFDQVTPLVAAGFDVLETSKNISILLAAVQILTALLQTLILIALVGLIITVSPDLEPERRELVTPLVRWSMSWLMDGRWLRVTVWTLVVGGLVGGYLGWSATQVARPPTVEVVVDPDEKPTDEGDGTEEEAKK